jgi:PAS domain S-box-containing protein
MNDQLSGGESIGWHNYTKLFSQAPAPIAIYKGRELRYVFVNAAYSKIFNERDILGKTVREAFPELEGQPFFGILEQVFDTGIPFHASEIPAQVDYLNDGNVTTRYYNLVYTPYTSLEGAIEGVMAFGHDVTEQVEARRKEKEMDLRFRSIVEQSSNPILILKGPELVLDVANEALFKLWNVGPEALGKTFLEILPEMREQVFYELLLDVYRNGKTRHGFEVEGFFVDEDGGQSVHYFNFIYQPYREAGEITGVLVLATDVTEQVLVKQKLAQSEINFENMILQAPVAICVLKGPKHVVQIANELMYELWGRKKEEVYGLPIFEALPEARGQGLEVLLDGVYATGKPFIANERPVQLPRNGKVETVYINFVYEAYHEGDGSISGIIAVATDVSEQVLSRHKVEYAEENARLAIESADLGTYELNFETNEVVTSHRFNTIWGMDRQATRDQLAAAIHPDDIHIRLEAHEEAFRTGNLDYEARIIRSDGSQLWIRVKGRVLYDQEGKPERLLGVIQDITEQKHFAEKLSALVDERTRALKEANEQLARSNEELEQFAYIASHDLQEPLRKIQLFNAMVLEMPEVGSKARNYIEKVSNAASRMSGLIRDLLEYSRLAQKQSRFERTDLNGIVGNVLNDFELLISQKEAALQTSHLPSLEAIPLQMNQLFYNLIGNALKFSRRNERPAIGISCRKLQTEEVRQHPQLEPGRTYYEISISDNGIGFNQDYAEKIFTIFQRLNEKSRFVGYGIGLALCRKIVLNHGGVIMAEGQPGEGATFRFILPEKQNR